LNPPCQPVSQDRTRLFGSALPNLALGGQVGTRSEAHPSSALPSLALGGQGPGLRAGASGARPQPGRSDRGADRVGAAHRSALRAHPPGAACIWRDAAQWCWRDARPGPLSLLQCRLEGERCAGGCGGEKGLGLLAGSHAPDERQPDGLAAPEGVRFAVEELVTAGGTFAVDHRTAAGTRAPAHGGLVPRAPVPAIPGCCHE
jgi:hypothetical protein